MILRFVTTVRNLSFMSSQDIYKSFTDRTVGNKCRKLNEHVQIRTDVSDNNNLSRYHKEPPSRSLPSWLRPSMLLQASVTVFLHRDCNGQLRHRTNVRPSPYPTERRFEVRGVLDQTGMEIHRGARRRRRIPRQNPGR